MNQLVCVKKKPVKYSTAPDPESAKVQETTFAEIHEIGAFAAKTHLSAILEKVAKGATFIVTKHGKKVAEIKPISAPVKQRVLGDWKGRIWMAPDFDAPLEDFAEYME